MNVFYWKVEEWVEEWGAHFERGRGFALLSDCAVVAAVERTQEGRWWRWRWWRWAMNEQLLLGRHVVLNIGVLPRES